MTTIFGLSDLGPCAGFGPKARGLDIIGALRARQALDALIAATQDRYQSVRWAAVRVLGDLGESHTLVLGGLGVGGADPQISAARMVFPGKRGSHHITAMLKSSDFGIRTFGLRKWRISAVF